MRKAFLLMVLIVFSGSLWAAEFTLSAGAGGLLGGLFTRYTGSSSSGKMTQKVNQVNYGGFAFFDATYAEFALIMQGGFNNYDELMNLNGSVAPFSGDGWETMLGFSLLGKYPFTLSDRFSLFPLLGIEYQIALSERRRQDGGPIYDRTNSLSDTDNDGNPYKISDWNSFWINLGVGTDFNIVQGLFVRGELLYGFRLMTSYEKDGLEKMKTYLGDNDPKLSGLTSGPSIRLSVGYHFWNL